MRIEVSWLRQMIDCRMAPRALARRLVMAGLEAEALQESVPAAATAAVAARIKQAGRHPAADRLLLCELSIGHGRRARVVCGAPNVRAGQVAVYAPAGTELASGKRVEPAEIRGIKSEGVLCSEAELGLGSDDSRLLLLPQSVRPGMRLAAALGLGGWILDVSVTPNRGDCLSVIGVAREVAALTGGAVKSLFPPVVEGGTSARDLVRVEIKARDLCGRYTARVIRGVRVSPSPFWLRHRLETAGIRAINNIVDVTNFVMLERGQPLHAFDMEKIGGGRIVVRRAARKERFLTLDGLERQLTADDLVIADRAKPIALAGIMGGENSQIGDATTDVLLESAFFLPSAIRATAHRLGISSESSYRFERGVDPGGVVTALDRAAGLLQEMAGGEVCRGVVQARGNCRRTRAIRVKPQRVGKLLGVSVTAAEISRRLRAVGARVKRGAKGEILATPPSYRFDLGAEVDLIEEVARLKGYECIPMKLPRTAMAPDPIAPAAAIEQHLRALLLGQGMTEMVIPPFASREDNERFRSWVAAGAGQPVRLINPLSAEQGELRQSLLPGLLVAVRRNLNRGEAGVSAFCVGRVYSMGTGGRCIEHRFAAGVMCGCRPVQGIGAQAIPAGFRHVKGVLESVIERLRLGGVSWEPAETIGFLHPGKAAQVRVGADVFAILGAIHPRLQESLGLSADPWVFELDLQLAVDYAPPRSTFKPLPRYPAVRRDVSLVVQEKLRAGEIMSAIEALGNPLIEEVGLLDQYRGEQIADGCKGLTYSIAYRAPDRTLTDEEVNEIHGQVVKRITEGFGIAVRA